MQKEQKLQYKAYAAATQTVARTKQIVLLYEGAIRFLQQAREAMVENRIEDRYKLLIKASDIIGGLQACLDFDQGGQIAHILYGFYASIDGRIFSVHRTGSIDTVDQIIIELRQMRDVWQEIDNQTGGAEEAPAAAAQEQSASLPAAGAEGITFTA
jgi:flagellar protein FliS